MNKRLPISGICLALTVTHCAADFATGFGNDYSHEGELAGQGGWVIDDPTPDLSFFVRMNGSDAAALGGYYRSPLGSTASISHPVEIPLAGSSFYVSCAFIPSTSAFPGRNIFGWSLRDPEGGNLFSLRFIPSDSDADILNVFWLAGDSPPVSTGNAISYSAPYAFDLKFDTAASSNFGFTAVITGSNSVSFSGQLPGLDGKIWNAVTAEMERTDGIYGDNFMVFDDLSAAAPPPVDADNDGYSAEVELWFGTSDADALSAPTATFSLVSGAPSLTFPSVPGNPYLIEVSEDLGDWMTAGLVTATGTTTLWTESSPATGRRFFKVSKP